MWETKPWFLGGEETKEVRVENVQPMVSMYVADGGLDLSDTTEPAAVEEFQSVEVAAPAAPATIFDRISYFKYDHPIYFWLIVSCVGTLVGYALIEYFYRNRGEQ